MLLIDSIQAMLADSTKKYTNGTLTIKLLNTGYIINDSTNEVVSLDLDSAGWEIATDEESTLLFSIQSQLNSGQVAEYYKNENYYYIKPKFLVQRIQVNALTMSQRLLANPSLKAIRNISFSEVETAKIVDGTIKNNVTDAEITLSFKNVLDWVTYTNMTPCTFLEAIEAVKVDRAIYFENENVKTVWVPDDRQVSIYKDFINSGDWFILN